MKHSKRFSALLLALVMALALSVPAMATQEGTLTNGSITIDNAVVGQTYNAYQLLYLESYDTDSGAYAYKANSAWKAWLESQTTYVTFDEQGYVTWVTGADAAAFAKAAQEKAKTMTAADATATAESTTVSFTGLKLGYYLVDSTLGTLCSLDTTNPNVTIKEKNAVPSVDKQVKEDSTDVYGKTNDADINQTVEFKSTITAQAGAENYVFYDKMSNGLTYKNDAKVYTDADMTTELSASYYTVDNTADADGKYTFKITFTQDYLSTITSETKLYVKYSATVNSGAVVGLPGNPNEVFLEYGDSSNTKTTPKSKTITYTWDMDVLKYANGKKSDVLEGVEFVLLKKVDNVEYFAVVDENGKLTGWTPDGVKPETGAEEGKTYASVLTTDADGKIAIDGLDADTYYLREIKALPGFNVLSGDVEVKIDGATVGENDTPTYTTKLIEINNQSGTELPSTGGMGTTVLYVLGAALVLCAGVLLVTRRRMSR